MTWVELGGTANLLLGLRPAWDPRRVEGSPLFAPPVQALSTSAAEPAAAGAWGTPAVSLHDSAESLAACAFGHRVAGPAGGELPVGALMLAQGDRERALAGLRRFLGLDVGDDRAFMLVRVCRQAGESWHEALAMPPRRGFDRTVHLTREGRRAESRLRPGPRPHSPGGPRLSAVGAQRYIDYFYEHGTHFISRVRHGNVLLQAFAFERAALARLAAAAGLPHHDGPYTAEQALACAALVAPGGTTARGPIVALVPDPAVDAMIAGGDWCDERTGEDSLLAPFVDRHEEARRRLEDCRGGGPVALELTPLGQFLERYRSANWRRLLAGALRQRFGAAVDVPLSDGAGAESPHALLLHAPHERGRPEAHLSAYHERGRPEAHLSAYHERVHGRRLAALPESPASCTLLSQALDLENGEQVHLPGERVTLAARRIHAGAASAASAPCIVVTDTAYPTFTLLADRVDGMLGIANRSGTRRRTIVDGFVLADGSDARVHVESATHPPGGDDAERIAPLLALSLHTAERLLCHGGLPVEAALAHLDWLLSLAAGAGRPEALTPVAWRTLALRWSGARFGARAHGREDAEVDDYLGTVLEAASLADGATHRLDDDELDRHRITARRAHERFWHTASEVRERAARRLPADREALQAAQTALEPGERARFAERLGAASAIVDALEEAAASAASRTPDPAVWTLGPPGPAEWAGPRDEGWEAAVSAAQAYLQSRAEVILTSPLAAPYRVPPSEAGPPAAAELHLLRAHALTVAHNARTPLVPI